MTQKKGTKEHATQKWNDAKQCKNETTQKHKSKQNKNKRRRRVGWGV